MKILWIILCFIISITMPTGTFALSLDQKTSVYDSYALEKAGNYSKAIEAMIRVLQQNNANDYFVHLRLGWLFYASQKYKNAIDHYEKATQLVPSSVEALLGLSLAYLASGAFDRTIKVCQLILQKDPKNMTALQRIATAEIRQKDFAHAREHANEGSRLYPTDPIFLEQRAVALQALGQQQEAKAVLAYLLLISPQNEYALSQINAK